MDICPQAPVVDTVEASTAEMDRAQERFAVYRGLYEDLKARFPSLHDTA